MVTSFPLEEIIQAAGIPNIGGKLGINILNRNKRELTVSPLDADEQRKECHVLIMCRIMSAVDTSKLGSIFLPAFALVFCLNDEHEAAFLEVRIRRRSFIATLEADKMSLLP